MNARPIELPPRGLIEIFRNELVRNKPDGNPDELDNAAYFLALMHSLDAIAVREAQLLKGGGA